MREGDQCYWIRGEGDGVGEASGRRRRRGRDLCAEDSISEARIFQSRLLIPRTGCEECQHSDASERHRRRATSHSPPPLPRPLPLPPATATADC